MQLIYYSHSFREPDSGINEFFLELMVDERLTPSLDPKSGRLNAAKPERHLRSTDAMVTVLPWRDTGPSPYILWEIGLGLRSRRPQLVLLEDTLPDDLLPRGILQRRFSRRHLLREAREHRHAIQMLKAYVGNDPPPTYQPPDAQRCCAVIGASRLSAKQLAALNDLLQELRYSPFVIPAGPQLVEDIEIVRRLQRSAFCISLVEDLTPAEYYLLGIARAALTPTVLLTQNPGHAYAEFVPEQYQARFVARDDATGLVDTIRAETSIFEEDYLELTEEQQIKRYQAFQQSLLRGQRDGNAEDARRLAFSFVNNGDIDMSNINIRDVVGPVNVKSRLDNVTQTVRQAPGWTDENKNQLEGLLVELKAGLEAVAKEQPAAADRITRRAENVVTEATHPQPDKDFLKVSAEGLKEAAKAVAGIAPTVLTVAGKIAAFIAAMA